MASDGLEPPLPRNYLRPSVLLLLREQSGHGYDLLQRLTALGFRRDDPGRLYRALRGLEQDGFVRSSWEGSAGGPDRRVYELTRAGMEELHVQARALAESEAALAAFLSRYAEFVALGSSEDARAGRRG